MQTGKGDNLVRLRAVADAMRYVEVIRARCNLHYAFP